MLNLAILVTFKGRPPSNQQHSSSSTKNVIPIKRWGRDDNDNVSRIFMRFLSLPSFFSIVKTFTSNKGDMKKAVEKAITEAKWKTSTSATTSIVVGRLSGSASSGSDVLADCLTFDQFLAFYTGLVKRPEVKSVFSEWWARNWTDQMQIKDSFFSPGVKLIRERSRWKWTNSWNSWIVRGKENYNN